MSVVLGQATCNRLAIRLNTPCRFQGPLRVEFEHYSRVDLHCHTVPDWLSQSESSDFSSEVYPCRPAGSWFDMISAGGERFSPCWTAISFTTGATFGESWQPYVTTSLTLEGRNTLPGNGRRVVLYTMKLLFLRHQQAAEADIDAPGFCYNNPTPVHRGSSSRSEGVG